MPAAMLQGKPGILHDINLGQSTQQPEPHIVSTLEPASVHAYSQFISTLPALLKRNPEVYYDTIYPSRGQYTQAGCSVESYEQHCLKVFHLPTEPV